MQRKIENANNDFFRSNDIAIALKKYQVTLKTSRASGSPNLILKIH